MLRTHCLCDESDDGCSGECGDGDDVCADGDEYIGGNGDCGDGGGGDDEFNGDGEYQDFELKQETALWSGRCLCTRPTEVPRPQGG